MYRIYNLTLLSDIAASNKDVPLISRVKGHEFIPLERRDACKEVITHLTKLPGSSCSHRFFHFGVKLQENGGEGKVIEWCPQLCLKCLTVGFKIARLGQE